MKTTASIALVLAFPLLSLGQDGKQFHGDCSNPIELTVNREYIHAQSPSGPGSRQEFNGNHRILHYFPSEINTVWYRFTAPAEGTIVFDVHPFRARDDYDWMLFRQTGPASCDSICDYGVKPIRTNRARNDLRIGGSTGLRKDHENLHAPPGPGQSYSRPLRVKKGETYLLVLDNIYPGGEGHRIAVRYTGPNAYRPVSVKGKVVDKATGKPLSAKIYAVEDSTGRSLPGAPGDSATFSFDVPPGTRLHLAALKTGYLLTTINFTAGTADTSVVLALEPAVRGSRMVLFNIHFLPNKAKFQPNALPELQRLLEFMQQSSGKSIRITGHTNSNVFTSKSWLLDLSVYRAAAVRDFLTSHGIDPNRIRIAGAGGSRPLTRSNDMKEAMKNLRVEIELLN